MRKMFITFNGEISLESILASIVRLDEDRDLIGYLNKRIYDFSIKVVNNTSSRRKKVGLDIKSFKKSSENLLEMIVAKGPIIGEEFIGIDDLGELLMIMDFEDDIHKMLIKHLKTLQKEIRDYDEELLNEKIFATKDIALKIACFGAILNWLKETDTVITVDYPILGVPLYGASSKQDIDKYDIAVNILKNLELEIKGDLLSSCDVITALFLAKVPIETGASLSGRVKMWSLGEFNSKNQVISYIIDTNDNHDVEYMMETNIDDMSPERFEIIEKKLFDLGALDVFKTPIIMKKGRAATKLSVLSKEDHINKISDILFMDTTTLGFRMYKVDKIMLNRRNYNIKTSHGLVRVKAGIHEGKIIKYKAEFDDVKSIVVETGADIDEIYEEVDLKFKKIMKKHNTTV